MDNKTAKIVLSVLLLALALGLAVSASLLKKHAEEGGVSVAPDEILVGGIMDASGATSDVGRDYAMGMEEAFAFINDNGGVGGKNIRYLWYDYQYRMADAVSKYRLLERSGAVAVMGWGTGDTEALSKAVNEDRMPYVSASYAAHLADPEKTRYNLFFAPDYSTSARACLTAWTDARWNAHPDKGKRKPRLSCVYMFASPYCSAAVKAVQDHARLLGFEVGPDANLPLENRNAEAAVRELEEFSPDVVWHGNTTQSVAATLKEARRLGLNTDWLVNTWGFDENLPRLAGEAARGVMGATPCAFFGQDAPRMPQVLEYAKKIHPETPASERLIRTVQAWCDALLFWEAAKKAAGKGPLNGSGIMEDGFETMKDFEMGLGASPVTFSARDHRPSSECMVQEWRDGAFHKVARVDLAERWPEQWKTQWMGW